MSHLKEYTYLHVQEICAYVKQSFGKNYTVSGLTKWLKRNNFRYKKPHAVPAKADKDAQENFIDDYNKLKSTLSDQEAIFFADSTHPQHQTKLAYGWI